MKAWLKSLLFLLAMAILSLAWLVYFHNATFAGKLPQWGWLQNAVHALGEKKPEEVPEDEDPDNTKNEIPVHVARAKSATLHRYVEGFGIVTPRPQRKGEMAGGANLASPVVGVVAKVLCQVGDVVKAATPVIQLDDRLAESAEAQAEATLKQATASLEALKATPRPEQLQIAKLTVEKTQSAVQFAERNYERLKKLATEQGTSGKSVEQAAMELAAAQSEATISQKQLALLESSPTKQELQQEESKVAQAAAALATAKRQREMMTITAPIDATVVAVMVNPGESVDVTKTLVQLVALDRLVVDMDVPADQLPAAAKDLAAEIIPAAASTQPAGAPADPIMGKVAYASPQVDPRTGAVQVTIDVPAQSPLRPGQAVRVRVIAEEHKDCIAVPREAVVADENGDKVISIVEGNQATHKTVIVGFQEKVGDEDLIEVIDDNVKVGTVLVTAGAFGLPAATRVKVLD